MDKKKLNKLYQLVAELQHEIESQSDGRIFIESSEQIRTLAALYQLQDYIAMNQP